MTFDPLPSRPLDLIPDSRHFRVLEAGYESTGFRFVKLDYIDRDLREQDFNLGRLTSVRIGASPRISSTRPGFFVFRGSESAGFQCSDRSFILGRIDASTRTRGWSYGTPGLTDALALSWSARLLPVRRSDAGISSVATALVSCGINRTR